MRGHELFSFLGTVARLFNTFLDQLRLFTDPLEEEDPLYHQPSQGSSSSWLKLGSECSQFYLHFAFTLDEAGLFQKFISQQQLFERQDIFRWEDLLYTLMQHRDRFRPFFAALLARRLKARVQKRLVDTADRGDHVPEIVKYPCEERYFTRHLLGEYADIFGEAEAAEFSSMLRHWRYGAAREAKNERDSDFLSQGPILPPPLLPPNNSNTPGVSPASGAPAADFWS
ncbi:hypothetical protein CSUI_002009 [Cystoisospora suis]|uniref:Uncharacterized protein n=1 Tax=Cystoisospora suis TaxID=483139 RepID=A0A2C6L9Q5_9APIC|nr:hypothetical protein CSUI_002009 [Cystoisospora suis]